MSYGTARRHHRITEEGVALGQITSALAARGRRRLAEIGLDNIGIEQVRDEMCDSCACRLGTVPNGCVQTQLDILKAVVEAVPFLCHAPKDGRMCAGYIAARAEHVVRPLRPTTVALVKGWEFSPPDPETE